MLCVCVGDVMDVVFSVCIVLFSIIGSSELTLLVLTEWTFSIVFLPRKIYQCVRVNTRNF